MTEEQIEALNKGIVQPEYEYSQESDEFIAEINAKFREHQKKSVVTEQQ